MIEGDYGFEVTKTAFGLGRGNFVGDEKAGLSTLSAGVDGFGNYAGLNESVLEGHANCSGNCFGERRMVVVESSDPVGHLDCFGLASVKLVA